MSEIPKSDVDAEARKKLLEQLRVRLLKVNGVMLTEDYKLIADAVENFEVHNDDVYVCSFPKSGTNWTQEMIWCIANDLDFEKAKVPLIDRSPYLESTGTTKTVLEALRNAGFKITRPANSVEFCSQLSRPRIIKTHLHFKLLPRQIRTSEKKPKIIYVLRNPKDVCVSYYHYLQQMEGYRRKFDDFCKSFLDDQELYTPYWSHISGFWSMKDQDNVLFITYEDMKKDLPSVIRIAANFLDKKLDEQQVSILAQHLSFSNMKANPAINREDMYHVLKKLKSFDGDEVHRTFFRSGTTGQWNGMMNDETTKKFDEWIENNMKICEGLNF